MSVRGAGRERQREIDRDREREVLRPGWMEMAARWPRFRLRYALPAIMLIRIFGEPSVASLARALPLLSIAHAHRSTCRLLTFISI